MSSEVCLYTMALRHALLVLFGAIASGSSVRVTGSGMDDRDAGYASQAGTLTSTCWSLVDRLSNFTSQAAMEVNGWVLQGFSPDRTNFGEEFEGHCEDGCPASLKTTLHGQGYLAVVVQNSDDPSSENSMVQVRLDGQELARLAAQEEQVVELHYDDGSELQIEETSGVIRLKWLSCVHTYETHEGYNIGLPRWASVSDIGKPGIADGVYPHAAPPTAWPPLRDPLSSDGCFPGMRTWTARRNFGVKWIDTAAMVTGWAGFRHPYMEAAELNVGTDRTTPFGCSSRSPNMPRGAPFVIHHRDYYINTAKLISPLHYNVSKVGVALDLISDLDEARQIARDSGWRVVGHSLNPGNWLYVGWSSSFLVQQPDTRVCMLTFMGSKAVADWVANLHVWRANFCGLDVKVHMGFRNKWRNVVRYRDWQESIRSKLPKCAQVLVVGHSLGGACSELFAACAARAPGLEEEGHEDYSYINWTRGVPEVLPEI